MEMGVGSGASVRMWRDYFPNGQITGFDINPDCQKETNLPHILIVTGDQSIETDLDYACSLHSSGYYIINDDAGHQPEHQLFAFKHLLLRLPPGGIYILEDIGNHTVTEYLSRLAHRVVHANWNDDNDPFIRDHASKVESVSFYRDTSVTVMKEQF